MPVYVLIRHGPAPEDTEDENGQLNCSFPGCFMVDLSYDESVRLFGDKGDNPEDPNLFTEFVKKAWAQVTKPPDQGGMGHGHMLMGICTGLEYVAGGSPACGFEITSPKNSSVKYAPVNYILLYAVARKKNPQWDIALDYRKAAPGVTPAPFAFPP